MGIGLLVFACAARADEIDDAIKMLRSSDKEEQYKGAWLLQQQGPLAKRAVRFLVDALANESWAVQSTSSKALVAIGSDSVTPLVKAMRKNSDVSHRRAIAETLALIGPVDSKEDEALVGLLRDPDAEVREKIVDLLSRRGAVTLPFLMEALDEPDPRTRDHAASLLAQLGAAAVPRVTAAFLDMSPRRRAGAALVADYMGYAATDEMARRVRTLASDRDAEVRAAAAKALGRLAKQVPEAAATILALLADPERAVRDAAVTGGMALSEAYLPLFVTALTSVSGAGAHRVLVARRETALGPLDAALTADAPALRAAGLRVLGDFDPFVPVSDDRLVRGLEDADGGVRRAAADAIDRRCACEQPVRTALLKAAGDAEPAVRAGALRALRHTRRVDADDVRAAVRKAAKDGSAEVALAAAATLWELGAESDVVERALALLASEDAAMRDAAARALRPMGRAAESALEKLIEASKAHPSPAITDALGAIAAAHGEGILGREARFDRAPGRIRRSIDAALTWFDECQDRKDRSHNRRDGRWHPEKFGLHRGVRDAGAGYPQYAAGCTGLAVAAFLAAGRADTPAVREGLEFLIDRQYGAGCFNDGKALHFLIDHGYATIAMCEAWILTGNPRYRRSAQHAVRLCLACRNPGSAWRYVPRDGQNDTNVTAVMLHALALAERGGLEVDPDAMRGGAEWIKRMTDDQQIGYDVRGGWSARPEGLQDRYGPEFTASMSAAGLFGFALAGRHGVEPPEFAGAWKTCAALPPHWEGARVDMYFWYWGTLAFQLRPGREKSAWYKALGDSLVKNQVDDAPGLDGSFPPAGPWGPEGGRIYSTALCTLALATPIRYSDAFAEGKPAGAYRKAAKALAVLAKSKDQDLAARAELWLTRCGG